MGKVAGLEPKMRGCGSCGALVWAGFRCRANALEDFYGEEQDSSASENELLLS